MPTLFINSSTEDERLQYERLIAFAQEMNRLGRTAAHGTVLDQCERFALDAVRKLLREQLGRGNDKAVALFLLVTRPSDT